MPLAPANPALDEEDDPTLPPKPRIGTTGGVIPEQQSDIDARRQPVYSPDPAIRRSQVQGEIAQQKHKAFQQEHPFTPSSWEPNINTPETRRQDREYAGAAEDQFQYQQQVARTNEVERRRAEVAQRNAKNNQLEAQYRGSGQQFYADADQNLQPVIDAETGRPLFHATGWQAGTHPKTGKPVLTMRDKFGQRQFKEPPVVQSLDPHDDQMHYKLPDGTTVPAGSIDDFAKSPNYTVAKVALAAKTRQVKAVHQEALQPIRLMADQAVAQLEDAKVEIQGLDAEIEKLSTQVANATGPDGSPTPLSEGLGASLAQKQARRDQLDAMAKPRGELGQKAARAKTGFAIASATAMREAFVAQQNEIAARVKSQGGSLETDPTYQANLRGLQSAEQILGQGQQEIGGAKAAPQKPQQFETPLNAADEDSFQAWRQQNAPNDSGVDYDLRGAFKAGATPDANGHWPDTFKKPNHPTFSDQSMYASAAPGKAGRWDGDKFTPPDASSSSDPLQQSEPYIASQNGITRVGSVKMDEFARRYGDGRGPVRPDQLIKLQKRSKEIDQVLSNDDSSINQTMRDQFAKEKDYVDSLAKQRFARLPDAEQKRVAEATRDPTWWDALKGAGKSLAEEAAVGGGSALKGAELASFNMVNSDEFGNINPDAAAELERRRNLSPSARMEEVKKGPAYQLGNLIQEAAHEAYAKGAHENETAVAKALSAATGAAGGFAPLVASGPMAPVTMGLQTAGEEMQRIYDDQIQKGADPARAADFAQKRALASGALQATLFEVLPKPLQKLGNKLIVDKIAGGALKKFLANRVAQGVEGGIMGGASAAAGNVAAGRDAGEGVAESAGGLALMQAAMPRAGSAPTKSKGGEPAPKSEPKAPLTPEQQAAEAEFQKQLMEDRAPKTPSTAEEAANVFEPALKEKENVPPPAKSAAESAAVMQDVATTEEAGSKVASQQEAKAQKLVDQIQEATGKPREEILATRNGRDAAGWSKELEADAKYHANPLVVDPERRVTELKSEIAKHDEEWARHLEKTAAEAETHSQIQNDKDKAAAQFKITKDRHDALMERRDAIEKQLTEAERVRQSAKGGADLKKDLASKEGRDPPPEPVATAKKSEPTEPPSGGSKSDYERHQEINSEWMAAIKRGEGDLNRPEIKKLFEENEAIKNRHGGMPPGAPKVEAKTAEKPDLLKDENFDREWKDQGGRGGSENQVVFRDGKVYKRNYSAKTGQAVPNYGSIEKFNEHVALHNELFPSAKITMEGMSDTSDGPAPVVSQKEIKGTNASPKEIDTHMRELGFRPTDNGRTRYLNDKTGVEVSDLRDGNVLKDSDGVLHVIDPVIKQIKKKTEVAAPKTESKSEPKATPKAEPKAEPVHEITPPKDAAPISKDVEQHTAETVEGDKINKNWTAFGPDSGTLGVPRAEMPQIKSESRGALVNFLQARDIKAKRVMVRPGDLKPTQAEFSPAKVDAAREHRGSERPVLISADGHLIDGHHQWMAGLQDDPKTPMPAIKLEAPVDKLLAEIKEFPSTQSAPGIAAKTATKEPSVSAPATKRLSDRAIEALQKAKIDTKGKLFDVTQGAYVAAHNAAIDLAILGVRAGRAAVDVTKLAVARFKAKFPDHKPEQIEKLEADIQRAISERPPEPEPGTAKSKVPESLREVGVPTKDIEYDVRAQNERMIEARDVVKKEGASKAEGMISDRQLPADTRVAIGGVLLEQKMAELANAKPENVDAITRDIQRITNATRSGVSTESGQGVAMHNKIYENLAVGSAMEYTKAVTKDRVTQMGGKETVDAADAAAKVFNETKDQAERDKAIDKLKEKYSTKPARRMLDQLKRIEVVKDLNKLGVLTREDMVNVAGNAIGIPGISAKKLKHIADLANEITNAKDHATRSRAELKLADTLHIYKGVNPLDLEASMLTLNILSGPSTQLANLEGNALNLMTQLGTTAMVNPTKLGPIMKGMMEGIPLGWDQAKSILATGRGTKDFQDRTLGSSNALQNVDYARDFPKLNETAGDVLTKRARVIEKISRFMKAADAVFYYPAREAYARLVATKLLEGDFKGDELKQKVSEALHTTPESFEAARKQATGEGYTGIEAGRRVADIIEENRAKSDAGKQAVKESERFAAEATFNNEPVGLAGVIYRNLARTVKDADIGGVPVLKPWAMFLRVPANVFNATTNFTPVGASRAFFGMKGEKYRKGGTGENQWRNFTKDERNRLYLQSVIGTTLMAGLTARILDKDDVNISASGPSDPSKLAQLKASGWNPYSIKVGNKWISYKDSPLLVPLAIVGHVADAVRYQKSKSDLVLGSRVMDAVSHAPQIIFQTSMLSGLSDLMSSMGGKGDVMKSMERTLGSIPANLIIPYNRLLQQIDQSFDEKVYKENPVVDAVPFARREGEVQTDIQGRPRTYSPLTRFASSEKNDPVDMLLRQKNIFIPEAGKDSKIGNRVMTDEEYTKYRRVSGQRIRARLQTMAPQLRSMTQEKAQERIEQVAREERAKVRPLIGAGASGRN